jgi:hypothetical protein
MSMLMALLIGLAAPQDAPASDPVIAREALGDLARRTGRTDDASPAARAQEEKPQERPTVPQPGQNLVPSSFIDFDWLEIQPRVGVAIFSKDYHVDPSVCFGVVAHAPLTFLSPSSNPDGEYFGLFAKLDVAIIKRDIFPKLDKPGGPIFLFAVGLDYTIYRSENWLLMVEGGLQYCHYGGITDLQNGMAPVVGLKVGLAVSRSVSLSLTPEYIIADHNHIMMGWISVMIEW